jgi:23S rRNA (guanosine2251-2'-O)-methyltransferase
MGIIAQERHMPPLSGVLAKAATGAIETVNTYGVVNLSRTLEDLGKAGWFSIGLAGETRATIGQALNGADKVCLVLGSEGKGLRPNVAKHCDQLARIPISKDMESLNVSTAAAIALYEARRG